MCYRFMFLQILEVQGVYQRALLHQNQIFIFIGCGVTGKRLPFYALLNSFYYLYKRFVYHIHSLYVYMLRRGVISSQKSYIISYQA